MLMFGISLMLVGQLLQVLSEEDRGRTPLSNICSALQKVLPRRRSISHHHPGRGNSKDFHLEFIFQQQLAFTFQTEQIAFNKNHVQKY